MKLLGHAWVAVNAVAKGNRKLLILGSIVPEIMFSTKDHPFEYEEIHEGGEKVYEYLKKKKPELTDLSLGMICHGYKTGADHFNLDENLKVLGYASDNLEELRYKLVSILSVSDDQAKHRAHNILELAVELSIIRDHPEFIEEFNKVFQDKVARKEIKKVLADSFNKPQNEVDSCVDELFEKVKPEYFKSADGLARLWSELSSAFPDPEPDIKKLAELLEELSVNFAGKDKQFLEQIICWTRSNLDIVQSYPKSS